MKLQIITAFIILLISCLLMGMNLGMNLGNDLLLEIIWNVIKAAPQTRLKLVSKKFKALTEDMRIQKYVDEQMDFAKPKALDSWLGQTNLGLGVVRFLTGSLYAEELKGF